MFCILYSTVFPSYVLNTVFAVCVTNSSMGGAIAVHVASRQKLAALAGLVVIDVVEGLK